MGTAIDVAFPAAFVIVAPSVKVVVPAGANHTVFAASPLQRALRNVHVATQHMMVNDATYELTGRLLLGVPTQVNML